MSDKDEQAPLLRIITPSTTAEEVAAIVAVLSALGGGEPEAPRPASTWASTARRIGAPSAPGPGNWRASALPR